MSKIKTTKALTVVMLLSFLGLAGCNMSGTDKSKELELKEKELALKEKELELKEKGSKGDDSDKAKKTKKVKKVYTPRKNSAERKQIMNALRVPVQKEFMQDVIFLKKHLKILGNWAFMKGKMLNKVSGEQLDYSGTKYDGSDPSVYAILKKEGGRWTVEHVKYTKTFFTNASLEKKAKELGVPKEILPSEPTS